MAGSSYPKMQMASLFSFQAIQPFSFESIFPFINQFLLEIGKVKKPEDVGYYSGIVESVFGVSQLFVVLLTTRATDSWGRKPVILLGAVGVALSMILFGTSKSYTKMLVARSLGGLIGGTDTTIRVMASELASKESETHVFSILTAVYRIGQVIGQLLGGTLAHPEIKFPAIFKAPFWTEYPYALPCFVGAAYSLLCAVVGQLILKETRRHKQPKTQSSSAETTPLIEDVGRSASSVSIISVLTRPFTFFLLSRALFAFVSEIMFAGYPLFAFTPIPLGGLGLSETTIGLHMSARALATIMSIFAYSHLERGLGRMRLYRCTLISSLVTILLFPALHFIAKAGGINGVLWNVTLIMLFFTWAIGAGGWTSTTIIASNYARNAGALATVQSLISVSAIFPQTIAPALGNAMFAFSIQHTNILGGNLFWFVLLALGSISVVHSFKLQESRYDWRIDDESASPNSGIVRV